MEQQTKYNVLIVDDEKEILDLVQAVLRRQYNVISTTSGREALDILEKEDIAVVLTDHWMDGIKGIDILTDLAVNKPNIGRILISGLPDMKILKDAINKGYIHRFIAKPWEVDELRNIVQEEIKRYDALVKRERLMDDLLFKNNELSIAYEEILFQKRRMADLNREYKEQSQIAIELSEKFAAANIDLLDAQEQIKNKNTELQSANEKLEMLSVTDGLTGFYNRRHMEKLLDQEIGRSKRYEIDLSCMMVDLDKFKSANDNYGHLFGDTVLKVTAELIKRNVRETDFPARYGGDEFFVILPHTELDQAQALAERIYNDVLSFPFAPEKGIDYSQPISIGIAALDKDNDNKNALIKKVDEAMYGAKKQHNGPIIVYKSDKPT